jgi:hypothetical protein
MLIVIEKTFLFYFIFFYTNKMDASVSTNSNTARRYTGTSTQPVAGYSSLGNYYRKMDGTLGSTVSKVPVVLVPSFGGHGYNALQHGMCNDSLDSGYFTMCNAYPGSGCSRGGSCCPGKCTQTNKVYLDFNARNDYTNSKK